MVNLKTVLLTGATGFLGSHLLEALIKSGYKVIIIKRVNSNVNRIQHLLNHCIFLDSEKTKLTEIFESHPIEIVIHAATQYGHNSSLSELLKVNVLWPLEIIEVGVKNNIGAFINTDSFFTKNNNQYEHLNYYTYSKKCFRDILQHFKDKVTICNMQLEHVFGENDSEAKFVTNIMTRLLLNEENISLTEGSQKRDFIYVADVVSAYLKVIENLNGLPEFSHFEVGTGNSISIKDFVTILRSVVNSTSNLSFGSIPTRKGEFESSFANNTSLKKIGWQCNFTVEDALKRTASDQLLKKSV